MRPSKGARMPSKLLFLPIKHAWPGRDTFWLSLLLPPCQAPTGNWLSGQAVTRHRAGGISQGTSATWQGVLVTLCPWDSPVQPSESRGLLCKGDLSPLRKREEQKSIVCSPSSPGPPLPLLHHHHHRTRTLFTLLEGDICY